MSTGLINQAMDYLADNQEWKEITGVSITTTTGDLSSGNMKFYQRNGLLFVIVNNMNRAAQTNPGSNMYTANITGLPSFENFVMAGYDGSSGIFVYLKYGETTSTLTARVVGSALPANAKISVRGITKMP